MWTEDKPRFVERHYTIDEPINEPKNAKGTREGKIPLWIGGGGERVTLKLVAQFGDACNFGGGDPVVIRRKLDVLQRHCDAVGRDDDTIVKSTSVNVCLLEDGADPAKATATARGNASLEEFQKQFWVGTAGEINERLQQVIEAGINYVIVYLPRLAYDQDLLRRFSRDVIPAFTSPG